MELCARWRVTPDYKAFPKPLPAEQRTCALNSIGLSEYLSYFWLYEHARQVTTCGNVSGEDREDSSASSALVKPFWGIETRSPKALQGSHAIPATPKPPKEIRVQREPFVGGESSDWGDPVGSTSAAESPVKGDKPWDSRGVGKS